MASVRYQPQGVARLNTNNPLTRGLKVALTGSSSKARVVNHANGRVLSPTLYGGSSGYVPPTVCPLGLGWNNAGPNAGWSSDTTADEGIGGLNEATMMTLVVHTGAIDTSDTESNHVLFANGGSANYAVQYVSGIYAPAYNNQRTVGVRWRYENYNGAATFEKTNFFARGGVYCLVSTFKRNAVATLYSNGTLLGTANTGDFALDGVSIGSGMHVGISSGNGSHHVMLACSWNRALTSAEIAQISANPWQIFADLYEDDEYPDTRVFGTVEMAGPKRTQPQGAARINTSHPLAYKLAAHLSLANNVTKDAVDCTNWNLVNYSRIAAPRGTGLSVKGATASYAWRPLPSSVGTSATAPITLRFRLFLRAPSIPTPLISWGATPQDGSPRLYYRINGSNQLNVYYNGSYTALGTLQVGVEYILTHTCDSAGLVSTYLNGVLVGSGYTSNSGNYTNLYFGMGYDGSFASTDYLISDCAVWSRALSQAEVVSDAQNPWQMFNETYEYDEFSTAPAGGGPNIVAVSGVSASSSSLSAIARAIYGAYGGSVGASNASASVAGIVNASGSAGGVATNASTMISLFNSNGGSSGTGNAASNTVSLCVTNGSSVNTVSVSGNAYAVWNVSGNSAAISTASASGSGIVPTDAQAMSGTSTGTSTAAATAVSFFQAIANAISYATATGSGGSRSQTSANATGSAAVAGNAVSGFTVNAASSGSASAASQAVMVACATGGAAGAGIAQSVSVVIYNAAGMSASASTLAAIVNAVVATVGTSEGKVVVTGKTEGGVHYTASGDKFSLTVVLSPYKVELNESPYKLTLN